MDQQKESGERKKVRRIVTQDLYSGQQTLAIGSSNPGYDAFAELVPHLDDIGRDLARPALLLAADEAPGLNFQRYLLMLDDLADEALHKVVLDADSECEGARRLAEFLAFDKGFCGNIANYYDHRNSFLSDVLDRRVGIPISLSLVLIEVGRRLGMPLVGIGFPGHFMVGCGPHKRNEYLLIDPFCNGKVVDWSECELRLQALGKEFDPDTHLTPVSNRGFVIRMLMNLKRVYLSKHDIPRLIRTLDRIELLDSGIVNEYKRLAEVFAADGSYMSARRMLDAYLVYRTEGEGADAARKLLSQLNNIRARRN